MRGIKMYREEINAKIKIFENKYGEIKHNKITGKYELDVNGHILVKSNHVEFLNTFKIFEGILENLKLYKETLNYYYIKNNEIILNITTKDNNTYECTMRRYNCTLNVRQKLNNIVEHNKHKLLSTYISHDTPILIDFKCGHKPQYINSDNYMAGHNNCRYCSRQLTSENESVYMVRKDLLPYFKNIEDSKRVLPRSNQIFTFKCPICGFEKDYSVNYLSTKGFSCDNCSDGISYPNKMIRNLLDELNIEYDTEVCFDWCKYTYNGETHYGIYDVVIESKRIIIEMDGQFHFKDTTFDTKDDVLDRDLFKEWLADDYGYTVYRVDCNYSANDNKFEYIKNSIIKSLSKILDLEAVNWEYIGIKSDQSILKDICDTWNNGYSSKYIINKFKIGRQMAINLLNRGHSLGLCTYTKELSNRRAAYFRAFRHNNYLKATIDNKIIGVLWDYNIFSRNYEKIYNFPMNRSVISRVVRGDAHSTLGGVVFTSITKEEYIELLQLENIITDDGVGNNDDYLVRIFPEYEQFV